MENPLHRDNAGGTNVYTDCLLDRLSIFFFFFFFFYNFLIYFFLFSHSAALPVIFLNGLEFQIVTIKNAYDLFLNLFVYFQLFKCD